ncbi:hypothetical protein Fcan01_27380 [Folsomia candida]|uniref:Uncharacterized protein n=1 Tax=Folsomia candida TaxID=158441 RepID=A0A226CWY4_FOLCA|nr:hypothetical protein Fcan01_27380 [Folsomia candida]
MHVILTLVVTCDDDVVTEFNGDLHFDLKGHLKVLFLSGSYRLVQSADHTGCDHLSLNDLMKLLADRLSNIPMKDDLAALETRFIAKLDGLKYDLEALIKAAGRKQGKS